MTLTVTQGLEQPYLGNGQIRPDLSSIGPLSISAGGNGGQYPADPLALADVGMGATNPPASDITGSAGAFWAPYIAGTTTGTTYTSTDDFVNFLGPWQKSWVTAAQAGNGLDTGFTDTVTGDDLAYNFGSGVVHVGSSYASDLYFYIGAGGLAGAVAVPTECVYQWDNLVDVPTLSVYTLAADGSLTLAEQTALDPSLWSTYAGLFSSITGGVINSMDNIFVLYIFPPMASIAGFLAGEQVAPAGLLSETSGYQPGGGMIAFGGPITGYTPPTPSPLPIPQQGADQSDPPHAPIGPPGDSPPYAPGYPIGYPDGYSGSTLPGLPAYKYLLRASDLTSVLNGFFVQMSVVLSLYADQGDTGFLRQRQLDLNGNVISNLETAVTGDQLVRLDQVHT